MFTVSGENGYSLFSGEDEQLKTFEIAVIHLRNSFLRVCAVPDPVPRAGDTLQKFCVWWGR